MYLGNDPLGPERVVNGGLYKHPPFDFRHPGFLVASLFPPIGQDLFRVGGGNHNNAVFIPHNEIPRMHRHTPAGDRVTKFPRAILAPHGGGDEPGKDGVGLFLQLLDIPDAPVDDDAGQPRLEGRGGNKLPQNAAGGAATGIHHQDVPRPHQPQAFVEHQVIPRPQPQGGRRACYGAPLQDGLDGRVHGVEVVHPVADGGGAQRLQGGGQLQRGAGPIRGDAKAHHPFPCFHNASSFLQNCRFFQKKNSFSLFSISFHYNLDF